MSTKNQIEKKMYNSHMQGFLEGRLGDKCNFCPSKYFSKKVSTSQHVVAKTIAFTINKIRIITHYEILKYVLHTYLINYYCSSL